MRMMTNRKHQPDGARRVEKERSPFPPAHEKGPEPTIHTAPPALLRDHRVRQRERHVVN